MREVGSDYFVCSKFVPATKAFLTLNRGLKLSLMSNTVKIIESIIFNKTDRFEADIKDFCLANDKQRASKVDDERAYLRTDGLLLEMDSAGK